MTAQSVYTAHVHFSPEFLLFHLRVEGEHAGAAIFPQLAGFMCSLHFLQKGISAVAFASPILTGLLLNELEWQIVEQHEDQHYSDQH